MTSYPEGLFCYVRLIVHSLFECLKLVARKMVTLYSTLNSFVRLFIELCHYWGKYYSYLSVL